MFKGVMLAFYDGGGFGDVLNQWEAVGFFDYVLPFLLIFALVYGILIQVNIFKENRFINGFIALAVGLIALQFGYVSAFFSNIFPMVGIGLAIILIAIIFLGLFFPTEKWSVYVLFGVGAVIFLTIMYKVAGNFGWTYGSWWQDNLTTLLAVVFILVIVGIIVASSTPASKKPTFQDIASKIFRDMGVAK
ncbi:MAG: hypothetical protein ABIA78_00320 [archaeon]